ncbi:MAG: YhbY family RNA-binding protein [Betaproteobacteria bacterium]|nr:YhbY family RNA-binding protein [Betaproteobacteria bacterium]
MKPLSPAERRALRAQAHHLDPVVLVGQHGLTPAVLHEIDLALLKHELVKVRIATDDRAAREAALVQLAADLECAPVQHLGKVLVLWRPNPDKKQKETPPPAPRPARRTSGRRAPVDPVRERRRTRGDEALPATGKGRRGAARHAAPEPAVEATGRAPAARRKSTFTPKTTPKSFSAKPNPRSAWEKDKAPPRAPAKPRAKSAAAAPRSPGKPATKTPAAGARRRRTPT